MTELAKQHRIVPQPWMVEPATRAVLTALSAGDVEARFVGGSVRDALLGQRISDIDIATPAPPQERVPHRTADKPRLDASCRKCRQDRASRRLDHPRLWNNPVLVREVRH